MKYYIDYCTGAGNEWVDGTLEDAMKTAEEGLAYTQQPVIIFDEEHNEVARLPWWGVSPKEEDIVTALFGNYGFYGEWQYE